MATIEEQLKKAQIEAAKLREALRKAKAANRKGAASGPQLPRQSSRLLGGFPVLQRYFLEVFRRAPHHPVNHLYRRIDEA
jgi:hypothetical protein